MYCSYIGNDICQNQTSSSVPVDYQKAASESKATNISITLPSGSAGVYFYSSYLVLIYIQTFLMLKQYQLNYN